MAQINPHTADIQLSPDRINLRINYVILLVKLMLNIIAETRK